MDLRMLPPCVSDCQMAFPTTAPHFVKPLRNPPILAAFGPTSVGSLWDLFRSSQTVRRPGERGWVLMGRNLRAGGSIPERPTEEVPF